MAEKVDLPDIVAKVFALLEPLQPEERTRVVKSARMLLGDSDAGSGQTGMSVSPDLPSTDFGAKASRWMQQNNIKLDMLHEVFHWNDGDVEIIASGLPGRGKRTQSHECYLLCGIRALLAKDDPKFEDSDAVGLCKRMGCHDSPNHAKYRREFGNSVAGSQSSGFSLPVPGLRAAAELIKAMTAG